MKSNNYLNKGVCLIFLTSGVYSLVSFSENKKKITSESTVKIRSLNGIKERLVIENRRNASKKINEPASNKNDEKGFIATKEGTKGNEASEVKADSKNDVKKSDINSVSTNEDAATTALNEDKKDANLDVAPSVADASDKAAVPAVAEGADTGQNSSKSVTQEQDKLTINKKRDSGVAPFVTHRKADGGNFKSEVRKNFSSSSKNKGLRTPAGMVPIQGGVYVIGRACNDIFSAVHPPARKVTISGFYMDRTEVTNAEYRKHIIILRDKKAEFDSMALKEMPNFEINNNNANYYRSLCDILQELSEDFIDKAIPDMSVLKKSFSNSMADVMLDNYYYDDSYSEYPVVCVKWDQANLFSQCRTLYLNEFCLENHKNLYPSFFLPTSNQWNYVASNSEQRCCIYPWCVYYTRNSEGYLYGNFKSMDGDCNDNGHGSSYMSNVYMYDPNQLGVYDMGGNVSEWTRDAYDLGALYNCNAIDPVNDDPNNPMKVVVGANYHSPAREAQIGHMESQHKDVARPDIGFRNCMSIIETPTWHKSKGKGKKTRSRSK